MKIVIANGNSSAKYIIKMFTEERQKNELIVINNQKDVARQIVEELDVPVYEGSPWRKFVLEEANVKDADLFISLCDEDVDNFGSCILAKTLFGVKKCICVTYNPQNVELYQKLGIDTVISSTYLLARTIRSESSMQSLFKTLSIDNDKVVVIEAIVLSRYKIANKKIKDVNFPKYASIAAISRRFTIEIPEGETVLKPKDQLLIVTTPDRRQDVLDFIQRK